MVVINKIIKITAEGICDLQDITQEVREVLEELELKEGIVCVFVKGTTVGVMINEFEPNLMQDFCDLMEKLIPQDLPTKHGNTWGDDNGFSHLRASLIGPSVTIPIKNGQMTLGTWQQIVLCDFDNRSREREVIVQVIGE